ncbi:MAG: RpiB/LacA/LacB family sugar-phosphate isomerase [Bacteroidetes bacterium]|nr:RpiB/LacA/LacB family sugar-phosphate isomerase [Bacteroidota bacterium]
MIQTESRKVPIPGIRSGTSVGGTWTYVHQSSMNANILTLPGRFLDAETGIEILKKFLDTPFEGGRH